MNSRSNSAIPANSVESSRPWADEVSHNGSPSDHLVGELGMLAPDNNGWPPPIPATTFGNMTYRSHTLKSVTS
jgi:hypothetical protein